MTIILPRQPTAVLASPRLASPLAVIADGGVRQHVPLKSKLPLISLLPLSSPSPHLPSGCP